MQAHFFQGSKQFCLIILVDFVKCHIDIIHLTTMHFKIKMNLISHSGISNLVHDAEARNMSGA